MSQEKQILEKESSYIKAYEDVDLLKADVMRPVRMQLEVLKPELYLPLLLHLKAFCS